MDDNSLAYEWMNYEILKTSHCTEHRMQMPILSSWHKVKQVKQKPKQYSPHSLDGDGLEDVFPPACAHTEATDARRDGIRMIKGIEIKAFIKLQSWSREQWAYNSSIEFSEVKM